MTTQEANKKIDELLKRHDSITTQQVAELLSLSRQRAHALLSGRVLNGNLVRIGRTRGAHYMRSGDGYPTQAEFTKIYRNVDLKEHETLQEVRERFTPLKLARDNVRSIFDYAFSEMLNNAIEHSRSERIQVSVSISGGKPGIPSLLSFTIRDWGIGAFRNVMQSRKLSSELEAAQDLLKGKTTTMPQAHSGEGIFFTSRVADRFLLRSFGLEMRVDNTLPDVFLTNLEVPVEGTEVRFSLAYKSRRHLRDIFRAYESDPGNQAFDRTEILVRLFTHGTIHVSRSQARRILSGLEKFKRITLDFERVPTIGQAFADEIFRVFRTRHPGIRVDVTNANEAVAFMINRVDFATPEQNQLGV